jgi:hypothetical protein
VLIADYSISAKTSKDIELVSFHFDHKIGRSILGNCYLGFRQFYPQLGYHNGINFYPVNVVETNIDGLCNMKDLLEKINSRIIDVGGGLNAQQSGHI